MSFFKYFLDKKCDKLSQMGFAIEYIETKKRRNKPCACDVQKDSSRRVDGDKIIDIREKEMLAFQNCRVLLSMLTITKKLPHYSRVFALEMLLSFFHN